MGGGWINPLQPLPQGLVLTFDVDPDPELDNTMYLYGFPKGGLPTNLGPTYVFLVP